jgi:hypothetical protein
MSTVLDDLERFHQFARGRLTGGASPASLDELLMEWHDLHDRDAVNAAIRRGFADVDAESYDTAARSIETLRQEFGFVKE